MATCAPSLAPCRRVAVQIDCALVVVVAIEWLETSNGSIVVVWRHIPLLGNAIVVLNCDIRVVPAQNQKFVSVFPLTPLTPFLPLLFIFLASFVSSFISMIPLVSFIRLVTLIACVPINVFIAIIVLFAQPAVDAAVLLAVARRAAA